MNISYNNKKLIIISAISILTFICFSYCLHNQFTLWDDDYYVTNDPYIKAFTPHNLKVIFTRDITKNNFHPLCMLSLAVNYFFAGLNPASYYLTNILLHISNMVLVFVLVLALCRRLGMNEHGRMFIASFSALWFGIHPMHVESVAWIAERKDVLYAFFYIIGLLCYLRYTDSKEKKWYWLTFIVFIASCLSKPMAVVFPLSLLCLDFLLKRPFGRQLITEKILFFLFSLLCGGMAFYTQNKVGAVASFSTLSITERIMYASYGFVMYIYKLFNPAFLSTFYPYPYRYLDGSLPVIYYTAPFISLLLPAAILYIAYRVNKFYFRVLAFGIGFFVVNIMFVLQFVSVGAAIMADRYSYVAYIGLFFMIACLLQRLLTLMPAFKITIITLLILLSGMLSYVCYGRTYVWHDSETLLTDAIEKYPDQALLSYKWLGNYYLSTGALDKALTNYNVLIKLRAADARVYENVARIYTAKQDYSSATQAYQAASQLNAQRGKASPMAPSLPSRSVAPGGSKPQLSLALEAKVAKKGFEFIQEGNFDAALNQYDVLVKVNATNPYYHFYRGAALFNTKHIDNAIDEWLQAAALQDAEVKKSAAYNLSVAYDSVGKDSLAVYYLEMSKNLGYSVNPAFEDKLKKRKQARSK